MAGDGTDIHQVIMYGIDSDLDTLMRYTFDDDTFDVIGVVRDESGNQIDNTECLTYIPSGLAKGMYCLPRDGALGGKLLEINMFDATASVVMDCGSFEDITAMTTVKVAGEWRILAYDLNDEELMYIDPWARTITPLFSINSQIEGIAVAHDGAIYANTDTHLYTIDLVAETITLVGAMGTTKMEALEFVFGDESARIDIVGIPSSWTANGALIGFDDDIDEIKIINPNTGEARGYLCSFATVDAEGLVALTWWQDPYREVLVPSGD